MGGTTTQSLLNLDRNPTVFDVLVRFHCLITVTNEDTIGFVEGLSSKDGSVDLSQRESMMESIYPTRSTDVVYELSTGLNIE